VPELAEGAKNLIQKAKSPDLRGFCVFGVQDFCENDPGFVRDAGSRCVEAVHDPATG
jgi:hypothetical protein